MYPLLSSDTLEDIPESDEAEDESHEVKPNRAPANDDGTKKSNGHLDPPTMTTTTTNGALLVDTSEVRVSEAKDVRTAMSNGEATTLKSPPSMAPSFGEKDLLNLPAMDEELVKPGENWLDWPSLQGISRYKKDPTGTEKALHSFPTLITVENSRLT